MYYPIFFLPAGGLPFGGTNFQIFWFSTKWNIWNFLHVFAKVPQPKWPYGPWDHFMFSAKNDFMMVITSQIPLLGVPPLFSNYCNIELILFVQTEDNTSYFLRIQHFLFSQKQNSWGWGNQAPEAGGTCWPDPGAGGTCRAGRHYRVA